MRRVVILLTVLLAVALILWADATRPLLSCAVWYDGCNKCGRPFLLGPTMCTAMACQPSHKPTYVCLRRFFEPVR